MLRSWSPAAHEVQTFGSLGNLPCLVVLGLRCSQWMTTVAWLRFLRIGALP